MTSVEHERVQTRGLRSLLMKLAGKGLVRRFAMGGTRSNGESKAAGDITDSSRFAVAR